jgi:hypothetical protein
MLSELKAEREGIEQGIVVRELAPYWSDEM